MFQSQDLFFKPELLFASTSASVKWNTINSQAQLMKCIIKVYFTDRIVIFKDLSNNYVIKSPMISAIV